MGKKNAVGYNADVSQAAYEVVGNNAGGLSLSAIQAAMKTAVVVDIVSGDAKDDVAGVGARTLGVTFLDGDYVEKYEVVTMDGTTDVELNGGVAVHAVLKMRVLSAGTENDNAGVITAENVGNDVIAAIAASVNCTQQATLAVPANRNYVVEKITTQISGSATLCNVKLTEIDESGLAYDLVVAPALSSGGDTSIEVNITVLEKKVLLLQGITTAADDSMTCAILGRIR